MTSEKYLSLLYCTHIRIARRIAEPGTSDIPLEQHSAFIFTSICTFTKRVVYLSPSSPHFLFGAFSWQSIIINYTNSSYIHIYKYMTGQPQPICVMFTSIVCANTRCYAQLNQLNHPQTTRTRIASPPSLCRHRRLRVVLQLCFVRAFRCNVNVNNDNDSAANTAPP